MIKEEWIKKGYADEPVPEGIDLVAEIKRLCREKNAVIMSHYYTESVVQEVADFVGDSLALAQHAAKTDADVIVMCGVHFMGETNKILCPDKTVLVPDLGATCSLAVGCPGDEFAKFVEAHPGHTVISYVNTSAAVKAHTDIVVTSSNAKQIVDSLPADTPIIFGPDKNLGRYINEQTGRNMVLWDGACHVHSRFSPSKIKALKEIYPDAKVLAHPECPEAVLALADKIGSTSALLKFAKTNEAKAFIVVTEPGIFHRMRAEAPSKVFIPAPPDGCDCTCNECEYMKMINLKKIYNCLKYGWPSIEVDKDVADKAARSINNMLEISEKLGL